MKYSYFTVKESFCSDILGQYTAYGIGVRCDGVEVARVSDICTDRGAVEELVRRCNDGGLDIIHLLDVVEDIIN